MSANSKQKNAEKQPLRTSEEIYHRLKWDALFPQERVRIRYLDHLVGMKETPFWSFVPGGKIPWSRVWAFCLDDLILWDREARFDRVFGSGDTPENQTYSALLEQQNQQNQHHSQNTGTHQAGSIDSTGSTGSTKSTDRTKSTEHTEHTESTTSLTHIQAPAQIDFSMWLYQDGQWQQNTHVNLNTSPKIPETCSLLTFNVLFDRYDAKKIYSPERFAALLGFLEASGLVDWIALQEVEIELIEMLCESAYIQKNYVMSHTPNGYRNDKTTRSELLWLVRKTWLPFVQKVSLGFLPHTKHALALSLQLNQQQDTQKQDTQKQETQKPPIHLINTHLISDHRGDTSEKRADQLRSIAAWFAPKTGEQQADILICGDFNIQNEEILPYEITDLYQDVWPSIHPDDAGYTYHPQQNTLAGMMSRKQKAQRLDRLFLQKSSQMLDPLVIEMTATEPFLRTHAAQSDDFDRQEKHEKQDKYGFLSDHYALLTRFIIEPDGKRAQNDQNTPQSTQDKTQQQAQQRTKQATKRRFLSAHQLPASLHTALAWVWPVYGNHQADMREALGFLQSIRRMLDPSFARWPAHINFLFGFVAEPFFLDALHILQEQQQKDPESLWIGDAVLQKIEIFSQARHHTVCVTLDSRSEQKWLKIRELLLQIFPTCTAPQRLHLSFARFDRLVDAQRYVQKIQKLWQPQKIEIDTLSLLSRGSDTPFVLKESFSKESQISQQNTKTQHSIWQASTLKDALSMQGFDVPPILQYQIQTGLQTIKQAADAANLTVKPLGSLALGALGPWSDVDIAVFSPVTAQPEPIEVIVNKTRALYKPLMQGFRSVENAVVPIDQFYWTAFRNEKQEKSDKHQDKSQNKTDGIWIDVQYGLDGMLGAEDVALILAKISSQDITAYQTALRTIRALTEQYAVNDSAFGYFGGIAWAFLLLRIYEQYQQKQVSQNGNRTAEDLLEYFCETMLGASDADWQQIPTLADANINSARQLLPSCQAVLSDLFCTVLEAIWQEKAKEVPDFTQLWQAILPKSTYTPQHYAGSIYIHWPVKSDHAGNQQEEKHGWLRGHIRTWLARLDQKLSHHNVKIRPFTKEKYAHDDGRIGHECVGYEVALRDEIPSNVLPYVEEISDILRQKYAGVFGMDELQIKVIQKSRNHA